MQANGLLLTSIGLAQAIAEGLLLAPVTARLGARRTARLGYIAGAMGYGALSLALAGWMVVPAVVLLALGGLAVPSVRAMVSNQGGAKNQGEMQGVLTAVEGLTAVAAPLITAWLFFAFTSNALPIRFAGAPFLLAAATAVLAGALLQRL